LCYGIVTNGGEVLECDSDAKGKANLIVFITNNLNPESSDPKLSPNKAISEALIPRRAVLADSLNQTQAILSLVSRGVDTIGNR